jgi:ABC-type uncharacterized transport system ATPase subunit
MFTLGKTTTISMLTGLFMPTSGYAAICGYDIQTEMDKVHQVSQLCLHLCLRRVKGNGSVSSI